MRPIAPQGGMIYRGTPQIQGAPLSAYRRIPQIQRAPLVGRSDVLAGLGAHHPRHRHHQRGFTYFYGGWWYSSPWWEEYYPSGGDCEYAHRVCVASWGYQTDNYYVCMRDYGCY